MFIHVPFILFFFPKLNFQGQIVEGYSSSSSPPDALPMLCTSQRQNEDHQGGKSPQNRRDQAVEDANR